MKIKPNLNVHCSKSCNLRQLFVLIVLLLSSFEGFSQTPYTFHHRRYNIYDSKYDSAYNNNVNVRKKLADAMHDYITTAIIDSHANMMRTQQGLYVKRGFNGTDTQHIHTTTNFLPWHRQYIRDLEKYLLTRTDFNYSIFVPLPYWDPLTPVPTLFSSVDPNCSAATGEGNCNALQSNDISAGVQDVIPFTTASNLCTLNNNEYEHADAAGFSYDLQREYHDQVHYLLGGAIGSNSQRGPAVPLFYLWHAYIDDIWYSYDCNCQSNYNEFNNRTITADTTWSAPKIFVKGTITINSGATLTIGLNTIVEFAPSDTNLLGYRDNNRAPTIIVKPGGKLIVKKGAKLQSKRFFGEMGFEEGRDANNILLYKGINNYYFTHDLWNGVVVQGPTNNGGQNQFDAFGKPNDAVYGLVILEGGAEINDAKIGVLSEFGGIIQTVANPVDPPATSDGYRVKFNDCLTSIKIMSFANPGAEYRNACYISDCNFKWNYRIPLRKDYSDRQFIYLEGVYGVEIGGNTFENAENINTYTYGGNAAGYVYDFDKRGTGIKAVNATFLLRKSGYGGSKSSEVCPILPGRGNTFKKLSFGIDARFPGQGIPSYQIGITECEFLSNVKSIYIEGSRNLVISDNAFDYTQTTNMGFHSFSTPIRFIETKDVAEKISIVNNTMTVNQSPFGVHYIDINNTGSSISSGQIREIHFNSLTYNHSTSLSTSSVVRGINLIGDNQHLDLTCNKFVGLRNDWYINSGSSLKANQGAQSGKDVNNVNRGWSSTTNSVVTNIVNNGSTITVFASLPFNFSPPGTVNTPITFQANCGKRLCSEWMATSIFDKEESSFALNCFPNPATNKVYFNYNFGNSTAKSSIIIFDINGKQKYIQPLSQNFGTIEVNTSDFPAGMYFYRALMNDNIAESGKLLIVK